MTGKQWFSQSECVLRMVAHLKVHFQWYLLASNETEINVCVFSLIVIKAKAVLLLVTPHKPFFPQVLHAGSFGLLLEHHV